QVPDRALQTLRRLAVSLAVPDLSFQLAYRAFDRSTLPGHSDMAQGELGLGACEPSDLAPIFADLARCRLRATHQALIPDHVLVLAIPDVQEVAVVLLFELIDDVPVADVGARVLAIDDDGPGEVFVLVEIEAVRVGVLRMGAGMGGGGDGGSQEEHRGEREREPGGTAHGKPPVE